MTISQKDLDFGIILLNNFLSLGNPFFKKLYFRILVFLFFINTLGISVYQKISLDEELEIFLEPIDLNQNSEEILEINDLPD